MKTYKIILTFAVLIFAIVSILWVLGFIQQDQAMDVSGKAIGVVLILGVSALAIGKVISVPNSNSEEQKSNQQGPNFE
jgi:hypothetical protein